jgi:adenosylcobinamide-GDP ribazoletransferase
MLDSLLIAVSFMTTVPMPRLMRDPGAEALGRSAAWFPVIGLALGGGLAAALLGLRQVFDPLLAAALVVTLWAALTGGLHLDGLADCCDGLLGAHTTERRLQIMTDSRIGAFAGVGLTLFLILKVLAVANLPAQPIVALALAASLARWVVVPIARIGASPDSADLGAHFARGITPLPLGLAALLPLAWLGLGVAGDLGVLVAVLAAHLVAFGLMAFARQRLGQVTGDVLGMIIELCELAVLLVFAIRI